MSEYTLSAVIEARNQRWAEHEELINTYPGVTFSERFMAFYVHGCGRPDPRGEDIETR